MTNMGLYTRMFGSVRRPRSSDAFLLNPRKLSWVMKFCKEMWHQLSHHKNIVTIFHCLNPVIWLLLPIVSLHLSHNGVNAQLSKSVLVAECYLLHYVTLSVNAADALIWIAMSSIEMGLYRCTIGCGQCLHCFGARFLCCQNSHMNTGIIWNLGVPFFT